MNLAKYFTFAERVITPAIITRLQLNHEQKTSARAMHVTSYIDISKMAPEHVEELVARAF